MSKKTRPVRPTYPPGTPCAYCANVVFPLEREHVFPESWYADHTPWTEMMLVPACPDCNRFFGQMDNDARVLVLTCEPDDPATQSIQRQVQRSLDPSLAKNSRDRRAREKRHENLHSRLTAVGEDELNRAIWAVDQTAARVEHRTPSGLLVTGRPGLRLPPELQPTVVGKWTRGAYYYVEKHPLAPFAPLAWQSPTANSDPRELIELCSRSMPLIFGRPEFRVWGTKTLGDPMNSIWMFALWDKMVFFGLTGELASENFAEAMQRTMKRSDSAP